MVKFSRSFTTGRMNKVFDERVIPDGEYIDAMNVRMGSTEQSEIGVIENTKGNKPLTSLGTLTVLLLVLLLNVLGLLKIVQQKLFIGLSTTLTFL